MKMLTTLRSSLLAAGVALLVPQAVAEQTQSLDALLKQVERGRIQEQKEHRQREQRFTADKSQQQKLLKQMQAEQRSQEARSTELDKQFEANDKKLAEAETRLKERLGSLGEMFGHITSTAGDARSNFETSLVSVNHPNRDQFLSELVSVASSSTELPSIEQIEQLWFELQREMTEQGKVVRFSTPVTDVAGNSSEREVIRVGSFNIIDGDGRYLSFQNDHLVELPKQPAAKYTGMASELAGLNSGYSAMGIDPTGPTGGSLLAALIDSPTLVQRWHQGGIVGYVISALGVVAILLALWRLLVLTGVNSRVKAQLNSKNASDDNPLGRVLQAATANAQADLETLELKLNEAILKELPKLQSFEALLKIISAVAPLLGLLGTVTGMILTFQAITIYGAGDPKAMAGGISSALVTTVLGLVVAIPTVLMHTLVTGRSKRVIHILEEQTAGIVARHQEQ